MWLSRFDSIDVATRPLASKVGKDRDICLVKPESRAIWFIFGFVYGLVNHLDTDTNTKATGSWFLEPGRTISCVLARV